MSDKSKKKKALEAKDKASKKADKKAALSNTPPVWAKATRYEIYRV
jgi:hypothetical protein